MEKKLLLVYNPVSGKAQIKHYLSDIIDIYSSHDYCITLHPTKCAKDGYDYIKEHMTEYEVISVCGGDGMLNEAVGALCAMAAKPTDSIPPTASVPLTGAAVSGLITTPGTGAPPPPLLTASLSSAMQAK